MLVVAIRRDMPSAAILLLAVLTAPAQSNLLTNSGFEQGTEGWHWWYQKEPVEINVIAGDRGNCVQLLGESGTRVAFYQVGALQPQTWYRVTLRYMAGPNGTDAGQFGSLATRLVDANGKHFDYPLSMPFLDTFGEWQQVQGTFHAPLSAANVWIEINSKGACDLRIDDVSLEAIETPEAPRQPNTWAELTTPRERALWFSSWQYNLMPEKYRERGMKYGWRYLHMEQFDQLKRTRTLTWTLTDEMHETLAEKGIPACPCIHYPAKEHYKRFHGGTPPGDVPFIIDPKWHDALVAACKEVCGKYAKRPGIEYIFVEDEAFGKYIHAITPKEKRTSELWRQIDEQVRARFGEGKHGLPDGPDDPDARKWTAYYTWAGDQLNRTFHRLREVIDQSGCGAKLMGPDEAHILYPLPWCDLAETVDIFTGQSLPYRSTAIMYNTGLLTKAYRDMTGKPVHNATQIVMYSGSPSPEEVQRRYSQVLQNGGEGQMLIAEEWGDRELSHHQYSAPERWATVTNLLNLMARHRVTTPTDSRVGILYCSPTVKAMGNKMNSDAIHAAYAFCGPMLGAWPRIIDTYALAKDKANLEGLEVLILPKGEYETAEASERIDEFVQGGGVLICCDPRALGKDLIDGDLPAEGLLGAQVQGSAYQRKVYLRWPSSGRQRIYGPLSFSLTPGENTRVIGEYEDGSPAVTLHEHGSGYVVLFGANPLASAAVIHDEGWTQWWRALLTTYGVPMDLPIWKLRLPDEALVQPTVPEDVCVTGNNFVRCRNGVYLGANDAMDGHYLMSIAPDLSPETAGEGEIAFSQGDLTDRTQADKGPFGSMRIAKEPYKEADWANRWSAEAMKQGLFVEFVLPEPRRLTRVRMWYSGAMPGLVVEGYGEGGWADLANVHGQNVGQDVQETDIPLSGECSRVRLRFEAGEAAFALADIELWATRRP